MKGLTLCKQWQSTPISKSDATENKKEIITDRKLKKKNASLGSLLKQQNKTLFRKTKVDIQKV